MNEEIEKTTPPAEAAATPPQTGGELFYPLDWKTTEIRLKDGRFVHELRRPTTEQILAREEEIQTDIPIGKDGSFSMPDPTATEDVDAKFYDQLVVDAKGYNGDVPAAHKSAAFQGLYQREIYVDEETDAFAEEVPVLEEFGSGDEPDFTIVHVMRQPAESELKRFRRRSNNGQVKPGKRGKQRFVTSSNLKLMMETYALWLVRVEGATVEDFDAKLADYVDPLIQRRVVQALVEAVAGGLLD